MGPKITHWLLWRGFQERLDLQMPLLAHQLEPLPWLCRWAPLSSHRNECLELDSVMHLYWPHQRDDFKRLESTICMCWGGIPGRRELPRVKSLDAEAAMEWEKRGYQFWASGMISREKHSPLSGSCPPLWQEIPISLGSIAHPLFLFHTLSPQLVAFFSSSVRCRFVCT